MVGPKPIEEMTLEDLRVYHVPRASPPGGYEIWIGCVGDKEGFIYKHLSFNKFEQEAAQVPENAELQDSISEAWAKLHFDPSKRKLVASLSEFPAEIVPQGTAYRIVDNGGIPFICYVDEDSPGEGMACVSVYRTPATGYIDEDEWRMHWGDLEKQRLFYQEQVCVFDNVEQVYLGVDNAENEHGNSILVRLSSGDDDDTEKYVFVGWEIYSFKLERHDRVAQYFSRMGNSRVPYPVALTEQTVIFMLDSMRVPRREIAPYIDNEQYGRGEGERVTWDDSYYVFCDAQINRADAQAVKLTATKLDGLEVIAERSF
jgi:hypothetical protein